jgi:hypothetical protein
VRNRADATPRLLDRFIPHPDIRERHQITIRAPAGFVLQLARDFDMQSIPLVRAIFGLRARLLGAKVVPRRPAGLVAEMLGLGWGRLAEQPERFFVAGAVCQPWQPNVTFQAIAPERFAGFAEPDQVKIAWTLEAEPLGPALTRFATETRAVATDAAARARFRRYWWAFGVGIVLIRWLLLRAVRRQAEQRWQPDSAR